MTFESVRNQAELFLWSDFILKRHHAIGFIEWVCRVSPGYGVEIGGLGERFGALKCFGWKGQTRASRCCPWTPRKVYVLCFSSQPAKPYMAKATPILEPLPDLTLPSITSARLMDRSTENAWHRSLAQIYTFVYDTGNWKEALQSENTRELWNLHMDYELERQHKRQRDASTAQYSWTNLLFMQYLVKYYQKVWLVLFGRPFNNVLNWLWPFLTWMSSACFFLYWLQLVTWSSSLAGPSRSKLGVGNSSRTPGTKPPWNLLDAKVPL